MSSRMHLVAIKELAKSQGSGTWMPGEEFYDNPIHGKYLVDTGRAKLYEEAPKVKPAPKKVEAKAKAAPRKRTTRSKKK